MLIRKYLKANMLFQECYTETVEYSQVVTIDLSKIEPVVAGPKLPNDIKPLFQMKTKMREMLLNKRGKSGFGLDNKSIEKTIYF